ncbi:MAG: hypothetical protein ALECFALPRED_002962 [Alectoria fallacina]|uniref:Zn(2)-C6 fungal-type domain-containing protein n=1 Tax=Alectoria fallacina TaxID=1903189 RepID=A0A8H3I572_9LECA|nr:MAG: hypothetical protein ALECFALPRED_002962 [Alectoria fallacina]
MVSGEMMKQVGFKKAGKQRASIPPSDIRGQHLQPSRPHPPPYAPTAVLPMAAPSHQGSAQSRNAPKKVAIPRLRRSSEDQSLSKGSPLADKNRVAHACEPCRQRKTKCSGERPICQHCEDFKLPCVYADGKRDRTKKQLGSLAGRVEEYEQLLEELSLRAGIQDQALIRRTLDRELSPEDDDESATPSGKKAGVYQDPAGEYKASARAGSTGSLDCIDEDYNRNPSARATGYHGKNSEVTWMQRLKRQTSRNSEEEDEEDDDDDEDSLPDGQKKPTLHSDHFDSGYTPISESTYHCDDLTLTPPDHVDPFEVPSQATANMLFQSYLETVHTAFPIIGKNTFISQYQAFQLSQDPSEINHNWLAILNLIFAIGAKYSHLIKAEWSGDEIDHLIYFTRARILGFNFDTILGHAELQKVQITGLMSFYLMASNQINRAWATSGIAIRHASALGLNLRNDSKNVPETSKEIRYRVWWALCSLERILAIMTGRPASLSETDCTTPAPLPLEEDSFLGNNVPSPQDIALLRRLSSQQSGQTNGIMSTPSSTAYSSKVKTSPIDSMSPASLPSSQERKQIIPPCNALYFGYHTNLSTFTDEVLNRLYRADAMSKSWADIQSTIATLNSNIEKWRAKLPNVFDFTKKQRDRQFVRQRMSLGFFYYSVLTIINRPCLCRIDRKIPDQSGKAKDFNRETAMKCVHAARDMLELLPKEPNAVGLYTVAPWWCLVHYLMQAATVLMLELSFRTEHMPNEVEEIFDSAKKATDWLRSLSETDEVARRAWSLCNEMLRKVTPKVGRSPAEALNYDGVSDHQGPADDQMQGMDNTEITQVPATSSTYSPQQIYASSVPFQLPMFSSYDQFLSYCQIPTTSASGPYNDLFPTATDMDAMQHDGHANDGYLHEQDH